MAQDTAEKIKSTAQRTASTTEQTYLASAEDLRDLSVALIDVAHANIEAAFEFARQAAIARTPGEIIGLWTAHVPKQLELLNAQTRQLTELGQKLAMRAAPPITPDG